MEIEREHKYLIRVEGDLKACFGAPVNINQGYLMFGDPECRVRFRDGVYIVTVKRGKGERRWETPDAVGQVSQDLGLALLSACGVNRVDKTRYITPEGFEIDCYGGTLAGLQIMEYEMTDGEQAPPPFPDCVEVIRDVTDDPAFKNQALAKLSQPEAIKFVIENCRPPGVY